MHMMLLLMLISMLTTAALAAPKLPLTVQRAITSAMRSGSATELATVLDKHGLYANSVIAAQGYTLLHEAEVTAANQYGNTPLDEA